MTDREDNITDREVDWDAMTHLGTVDWSTMTDREDNITDLSTVDWEEIISLIDNVPGTAIPT